MLYSLTHCGRRGEGLKYKQGFGGFIPIKLECYYKYSLFPLQYGRDNFTENSFLFLNVI